MADSPYIGKIKNSGNQNIKVNVQQAKGTKTVKTGDDLRAGKTKK